MTGLLDRLNLRPAERRLVVLVAVVLFVVANLIFVWPYFGSWNLANLRLEKARQKLADYQKEMALTNTYRAQLTDFERENPEIPIDDQGLAFQRVLQNQAAQLGIGLNYSRSSTRTNDPFFLEQVQTVTATAKEKDLVELLYQLGTGSSLIRVREVTLQPDQNHYALNANITFVASYQRKPASKTSAPAKPAAGAARPATGPTTPTPTQPVAGAKPAATNAPAQGGGWWSSIKGWFGGGSSSAATPAKTNAIAKSAMPASPTNRVSPVRPNAPAPTPGVVKPNPNPTP